MSNKRRNAQAQAARVASIKNWKNTAETRYFDKTIAVTNKIRELTNRELEEFIAKVRDIKHIQKNMPEAVRLLQNRELPTSPLERAAVVEIAIQYF